MVGRQEPVILVILLCLAAIGTLQCSRFEGETLQGGSTRPAALIKESVNLIREKEASEKAKAKADEMKYSLADHAIDVADVDGHWEVSAVPTDPNRLGGGLVILIDKQTGEVVSAKFQQ